MVYFRPVDFNRKQIFSTHSWLKQSGLPFIISADYDGLICASFLHHYFDWQLVGYYDLETLWVSEAAKRSRDELIWVDLNILPHQGRAIGGHIISLNGDIPKGFGSSCNPNIMAGLTAKDFKSKFPFSTLIFLLWLHQIKIEKDLLARLLVLHSDASWLKFQEYPGNANTWMKKLTHFDWKWLFQKVDSPLFEKRVDQYLYPALKSIGAVSGSSKLTSKNLKIKSKQFQFNPDWDEDIILNLFELFGNTLKWTPPSLPKIIESIMGDRQKLSLSDINQMGINTFLKTKKVFSYAIPSPRTFNYTTFSKQRRSNPEMIK